LDWHFSVRDHLGYSLVRFTAQSARDRGFAVVSEPLPDNPAHAEVIGKKTPGGANALRDASEWVHLAGTSAVS